MREWEQTLVLIKPDGVSRGLVGQILSRYENKGLTIEAMVLRRMDDALTGQHYFEHVERGYYPRLRDFVTSGPLVALVLGGPGAIEAVRQLHGATDGVVATPGSIRGDFAMSTTENLVHASDDRESAEREISLWFPELRAQRG